jgi:hypothetical protein
LPNDGHAIGALVGAEHVCRREFDRFDQDQFTAHVALNAFWRGSHCWSLNSAEPVSREEAGSLLDQADANEPGQKYTT